MAGTGEGGPVYIRTVEAPLSCTHATRALISLEDPPPIPKSCLAPPAASFSLGFSPSSYGSSSLIYKQPQSLPSYSLPLNCMSSYTSPF